MKAIPTGLEFATRNRRGALNELEGVSNVVGLATEPTENSGFFSRNSVNSVAKSKISPSF
jgi:hypothetical protein